MSRPRPAVMVLPFLLLLPVAGGTRSLAATVPTGFADERAVTVGSGAALDRPVGMTFLPDGRLLVVEQKSAKVRLFVNGLLAATDPVLTVPSVRTSGGEQGLLGIAVDPDWPVRPYLYVHCDDSSGPWIRISRYTASGDLTFSSTGSLAVDPATRYDLLNRLPDNASNHNGGTLRFGPDGMLYVSLGEDANRCGAQDSSFLGGKILRLDVSRLPAGPGGPAPFAILIPPGNPWGAAPDSGARLVWAEGLRNPFRFSVDPADGALFVGDVGESTWEEIDRIADGGGNYGWPLREGPLALSPGCSNPLIAGLSPIYAYNRTGSGASIIGGCVYRRPAGGNGGLPAAYIGDFFFSEYYTGFLRRLVGSGDQWALATPVEGQPSSTDWGQGFDQVSDWAVGPDGALWYCRQSTAFAANTGDIRRIVAPGIVSAPLGGPAGVEFAPPRPTPAVGRVTLRYTLASPAWVSLAIYDVAGRRTRLLEPLALREAERHDVSWDGRDDAGRPARPGLYLARLEVGGRVLDRRVPLLR